jgi:glutamate synthase domain-containing protein 2
MGVLSYQLQKDTLMEIAVGMFSKGLEIFFFLLFVFLVIYLVIIFCIDRFQHKHTLRRNYPVIGRFRYFFEHLGIFFRQYFFAMDREELPFNRADRSWVYRAAKNSSQTVAFGSTKRLKDEGSFLFLNSTFPMPNAAPTSQLGPKIGLGEHAYQPKSLFNISGMSYGALSRPAVEALANGARMAGVWMNTGEGGISPYHLAAGCDIVMQIGTAKYGVRTKEGRLDEQRLKALASESVIKMFEIKLSQGAKPGKGGILPATKVTKEIAEIRGIEPYKDSISPNSHEEIRNPKELLDFINLVREKTKKPVGIKFVLGEWSWLDEFFQEILNRGVGSAPDFITLDGADGGTGAAPQSLLDYMGLPLQKSLPLVSDKLAEYGLKERIVLVASSKLIEPSIIAWALCMGADYVVSARGFMFSIGCIQAMQCHKNTCPTGVTTHDKKLQRGLDPVDKSHRAASYVKHVQDELAIIAHSCGLNSAWEFSRENAAIFTNNYECEPMKFVYPEKKGH